MTGLAVLIPFKATGAKSRLSPVLSTQSRRELAELMLLDVLDAFAAAGLLRRCFVVSSNGRALSLAEEAGATALEESSDRGVNSAVEWGMEKEAGAEEFMVVPSDLPLLRGSEIRDAYSFRAAGIDVVVSPSRRFDGTNLLLVSRSRPVSLSYDKNSFWNHIGAAAEAGRTLAVNSGMGFLFDVDTPADLVALASLRINRRSVAFARKALV